MFKKSKPKALITVLAQQPHSRSPPNPHRQNPVLFSKYEPLPVLRPSSTLQAAALVQLTAFDEQNRRSIHCVMELGADEVAASFHGPTTSRAETNYSPTANEQPRCRTMPASCQCTEFQKRRAIGFHARQSSSASFPYTTLI